MQRGIWFWVKWSGLVVSLGSVALAVILMQMRHIEPAGAPATKKKPSQTEVSKPLIVEKRGEHTIWKLQAKKAEQQLSGKMHLVSPVLTLFTEAGDAVPVQSSEAWFDPIRRDIDFRGAVEVHFQQWTLTSEKMVFSSSKDELLIPGAFAIHGKSLQAKGKSLRLDRRSQQLWVDQGIWIKDDNRSWQP